MYYSYVRCVERKGRREEKHKEEGKWGSLYVGIDQATCNLVAGKGIPRSPVCFLRLPATKLQVRNLAGLFPYLLCQSVALSNKRFSSLDPPQCKRFLPQEAFLPSFTGALQLPKHILLPCSRPNVPLQQASLAYLPPADLPPT
jgi:hypothetical protein